MTGSKATNAIRKVKGMDQIIHVGKLKTLKEICLSHGVRQKEREYIRLITIEYIEENPEFTAKELLEAIK